MCLAMASLLKALGHTFHHHGLLAPVALPLMIGQSETSTQKINLTELQIAKYLHLRALCYLVTHHQINIILRHFVVYCVSFGVSRIANCKMVKGSPFRGKCLPKVLHVANLLLI
jgi:hypothetical protein